MGVPLATSPQSDASAHIKRLFMAVTLALVAAASYSSWLVVQRQDALREVSRYNATWLLMQAAQEVSRLEAMVGRLLITGSDEDRERVQLWADIVANRAQLLDSGEVGEFLRLNPDLKQTVDDVRETIGATLPSERTIQQPVELRRQMNRLATLNPKLMRLASAAYTRSGEMAAADVEQLGRLHWLLSGLLGGLILCSTGLVSVMTWHNKLLARAHQEVQALVADLRRSGAELAEANLRTTRAMEETHRQNETLRQRDDELKLQNARFDAALNNMSQALCMVDSNQHLIVCNVRFLELFGLTEEMAVPGTPMAEVFRAITANSCFAHTLIDAVRIEQQALVFVHRWGRFQRESPDGAALAVSHQPMAGGGWVATYEDVTERQQAEARIRFMAHHDALTGLPNRTLLHERIEAMLHATPRQGRQLVVFCLDLDHFKNVNDSLGHPAGDALLQAVAGRLRHCVRDEDLIARLGGDEFAILYVATDYPAQAEQVAQRIVATLCEPYEVHGTRAIIGVSIGITLADADSTSADLLKNADLALYRAKGDGRGTYRFFEQEMEQEVQDRRTMELDLREAVSSDRFVLYYQPLFSLTSNRVSGFEALLRWDRPGSGLVSPASFVPLAEEIGLIHPIGEWVLRRAFRDAAAWPYRLKVAVNLSPEQFRDERLVELVQQALEESGLPATCVELEITESTLLQDNEKVVATLHRLRQLGVHIALDDFGTGYSSLSYLRSFPFDKLKIDQSFVREMAIRPDCRAIVNSISALASQLHITTTAEGVETEEHLAQIRAAGCTEAQGYYFSTPLPAASVGAWLASHVASGPTVAPSLGFMGATGRKRELLVSSAAAAK